MKRFSLVFVVVLAFGVSLTGCASLAGGLLNAGLEAGTDALAGVFHKHYVMTDKLQKDDFPALSKCQSREDNIWVCPRSGNAAVQDIYFIIPRTEKAKRDAKVVRVSKRKEREALRKSGGTVVYGSTLKGSDLITTKKMAERYTGWWLAVKQ